MFFFMAMEAQRLVRIWIAYDLTDSKIALGLLLAAVATPMMLIAPFGGAIADRVERRNLIVFGQAIVVANEGLILALLVSEQLAFWHLLCTSAVMGCVFPLIMPARAAIVVNIVGKEGVSQAVGLNMAGMNTMRVVGPGVAGYLLYLLGMKGAAAVGVAIYVLAFLCVLRVGRYRPQAAAREVSIGRNILDGVRYMREHRLVLVLLFFGLVPMFLAMPFGTLLVVFARDIWKVGEWGLGWLQAVGGLGGVAGAMLIAWRAPGGRRLGTMMWSVIGFGVFLVGLLDTQQRRDPVADPGRGARARLQLSDDVLLAPTAGDASDERPGRVLRRADRRGDGRGTLSGGRLDLLRVEPGAAPDGRRHPRGDGG
jgi:MFS family permease